MKQEYIKDGFGNEWAKCGSDCDMEVVRPGKVQCSCIEFESLWPNADKQNMKPNADMETTKTDEKCPDLLNQTPLTDDPFESPDHDNDDYTYAETYNPQQKR